MSQPAATPTASDDPPIGARRVLTPGRGKWLGVAAIAAVFVAIGIYLLLGRGSWIGWIALAFFGLVLAVSLAQIFGAGSRLTLDADTFEISNFGRRAVERWDEVAGFTTFKQHRIDMVGYDRLRDMNSRIGDLNRKMSGRTAALPDTFDMKADDLTALLEAYRENGVARSWQRHRAAVDELTATLPAELDASGRTGRVIVEPEEVRRALPNDMAPWPSILVTDGNEKRPDGRAKILIAVDVLNPNSRWIDRDTKERSVFDNLGANEFRLIDPSNHDVTRIRRDD
jgi:hypothetical protein